MVFVIGNKTRHGVKEFMKKIEDAHYVKFTMTLIH